MIINKRTEILFIYDVKDANPNGDPSDENKPRIDEESGINIVTDVRLKRTIRDYLFDYEGFNGEAEKDIFVRQTTADKGGLNDGKGRANMFKGNDKKEMLNAILSKCIDIRLFGGVIPLDKDSITFTGPVQFKMGRSLHRVEMKYIKGTGAFAATEGKSQQTFREEYILPYSLIAFYGIVNENAAKETQMTENDLNLLIKAIWEGTRNLITRSKFEHTPRLLMTLTHNQPEYFIGELNKYIKLNIKDGLREEQIRDISDVEIDLSALNHKINKADTQIQIKKDDRLTILNWEL